MKLGMRLLTLLLAAALLLSGCGGAALPGTDDGDETKAAEKKPAVYQDGVIPGKEGVEGKSVLDGLLDKLGGRKSADSKGSDLYYEEAVADAPMPAVPAENNSIRAGLLTAGEWNDLKHFAEWKEKLSEESWALLATMRQIQAAEAVHVTVKDGSYEGVDMPPVYNAAVELLAGDKVLAAGRTGVNGEVYLFYNLSFEDLYPEKVRVEGQEYALEGKRELTVYLQNSASVTALDLMLMVDTTGSMGDELEYLKEELKDMVKRIAVSGEALSIRVSVNFYRDETDEYIVKYFDFREDIDECVRQISEQVAYGGGDYPEAVHTALDNAVNGHAWREEAVKLCFLVLDAPPHVESEVQGVNDSLKKSLQTASRLGIRIIPVASSGVDTETEFLLRTFAVMTGGTYIFLTNDSGIGYDHKEVEAGDYETEALNECMIRVACEYCGLDYVCIDEPNINPNLPLPAQGDTVKDPARAE